MAPVVLQRRSRRSVAPAERAVALDAAVVRVELLPQLDGLFRRRRCARELDRLGDILGFANSGEKVVTKYARSDTSWSVSVGPGGHRGVGHAAPDDVDEVLVGRQRPVGSRPDLELARREVAGPRLQVRGGVPFAVALLAVALRAVLEVELLARLPLRLGPDVGTPARAPIPSARHTTTAIRTARHPSARGPIRREASSRPPPWREASGR